MKKRSRKAVMGSPAGDATRQSPAVSAPVASSEGKDGQAVSPAGGQEEQAAPAAPKPTVVQLHEEEDLYKNHWYYTGLLMLLVIGGLLALHFLPSLSLMGHPLRRVDILSDVFGSESGPDVPQVTVDKPRVFVDTCRVGYTCIEDFSDSTMRGMANYYRAIDSLTASHGRVRIAYFGDSFIEADILTADLREMLQHRYGGRGVGYIGITSHINDFRPTVRLYASGWDLHSSVDQSYFDDSKQDISGHYFVPSPQAYVQVKGQEKYGTLLDTCQIASIFFANRGTATIRVKVNDDPPYAQTFAPSAEPLRQMSVVGNIGKIRWTVERADSTLFYGLAMDDSCGIAVDNFSLRGSSGISLQHIPQAMMQRFNAIRPYDLVILQYGLNIATRSETNYDGYYEGMRKTIQYIKESFPQAGILIIGVADRDYRASDGEMRTMPGVLSLIQYQKKLAIEENVAFWNMFEAMGGSLSIMRLVHSNPSMANHDYTHINFRGGKYLAGLLYEALVYGKEQYDRRRSYEAED